MKKETKVIGKINDEQTHECVKFSVEIIDEDNKTLLFTMHYERLDERTWRVYCSPFLNSSANSMRVYNEIYAMPKRNMPLEKIASFGLAKIRSLMMEDVMNLNSYMYELSEMVKD